MTRFHNLLDICVGPHHHEWASYYGLVTRTWGVDIDEEAEGLRDCDMVSILDVNQALPFRARYFDLVLSDHTIEHLTNPLGFFQELQRVAEKMIILKTPQGWQDNFFRPKWLKRVTHEYHFKKSWFIENCSQAWTISTRTIPKIGSGAAEIEVILRRRLTKR